MSMMKNVVKGRLDVRHTGKGHDFELVVPIGKCKRARIAEDKLNEVVSEEIKPNTSFAEFVDIIKNIETDYNVQATIDRNLVKAWQEFDVSIGNTKKVPTAYGEEACYGECCGEDDPNFEPARK